VRQKKYFITYNSSKSFKFSNNHLINLALNSNLFDDVYNFSYKDLSQDFTRKYKNVLQQNRGGGYWLWKLNIIDQVFSKINKNDIVLYLDSGSTLNYFAKKRFDDYCYRLSSSDYGLLNFSTIFIEKEWTTQEIFDYFKINIDSEIANSPQREGGTLLFQKNDHSLSLIQEFYKLLNVDPYLITDKYNDSQNSEFFKENRHDQSIFSLLSKIYGSINYENETHFKNRESLQYSYPFLSTRHSDQNLFFKSIYYLNYSKSSTTPRFFVNENLNSLNKFYKKYFYFNTKLK